MVKKAHLNNLLGIIIMMMSFRVLCMKLPPMIGHVQCVDNNKTISFKVIKKGLLKRYIKIWERINNLTGKEFDSDPVYGDNDKYIRAKIKP